jgi:hypothetical protein
VDDMSTVESQIRPDLIDIMMDLYCEWRTECKEVQAAYERISRAQRADRTAAFAAYSAALDREESACDAYAAHIRAITSRHATDSSIRARLREGDRR